MENVDANQLPEVDAMPDGFVDGSTESLAPQTPNYEQEKPLKCNTNSVSGIEDSIERVPSDEPRNSQESSEKGNSRLFPIPLSEIDGFDVPQQSEVMPSENCVQLEEGESALPGSANLVSEDPIGLPRCSEAIEDVQENNQKSSDRKDMSSAESIELQKSRKPETTEPKKKNVKRSFKTEKEFLEFTLKYQQVLTERDTAIAIRDKLESLCRELQRQNKMLMEECKRVSTEGQNLRLDLSTKFQDAIKDVSNKLDEQKEESFSQLKENEMLRHKLKQLADQYTLSEQQYEQKLKHKSLELQLADLKMKQHEEKLLHEQSQMKVYAEQVSQLLSTEKNLRLQLTADGEKFQQFQDALVKSNEVFQTFKQEIEKMGKSIKELKKENVFLKSKSEKSDVTLIELVEEREKLKKQLEKTKNQKEKLESLCRSLQAERKQHATGIDTVPNDQL
ncbi:Beta-taxilin [Euphorbia peplus]|nr:Beta-taxilin [Euphorbia peplus]